MAKRKKPDKPAENTWGKTLKALRGRAGFTTQAEAAAFLEVPIDTYRKWEQGKNLPASYVIRGIVALLQSRIG